jgi:hypothetical protein
LWVFISSQLPSRSPVFLVKTGLFCFLSSDTGYCNPTSNGGFVGGTGYAFGGKLIAQWRETNRDNLENADSLLKRIQHERAERHRQKLVGTRKQVVVILNPKDNT